MSELTWGSSSEPLASQVPAAQPEERRGRGRLGALLTAYYGIEGSEPAASSSASAAPRQPAVPLDREEFDAKRHFDSIVATGMVADVMRHANEIDAEVRDLDGDMQMVVYENYSKFIRSMEVTKQMKVSVEGLEPDLKSLEGSFTRISEHQRKVEDGVSGRAGEIEDLLKQQSICKKLQVLFDLPMTLQRCLTQGAYGRAVEAYCCCAGFLRQHKHIKTLETVLHDVEHQMGRIRSALEKRLRSSELSVEEAANSSVTLLDLGQDRAQVERDYLDGRAATLRVSLDQCFAASGAAPAAAGDSAGESREEAVPTNGDDLHPESAKLRSAAFHATQYYVPHLSKAVDGYRKLGAGREAVSGDPADDTVLSGFAGARIEELFERIITLVEANCPPIHVLVACVTSIRGSLSRLHTLLPGVVAKLLTSFISTIVNAATKALCADTASGLTADFIRLHEDCKRLQERSSGLDGLLEEVGKAEQSLAARSLTAVGSCQPLIGLVGSDRSAGQRLTRGLREMVMALMLTFAKVSWTYCGQEPNLDPSLPTALRTVPVQLQEAIGGLEWVGFFGLAIVWIGRRWEERVVGKAWATVRELLAKVADAELALEPEVPAATQAAAEAAITHFVLVGGQRLAHFLRNSMRNRNWMAAKEPQEPSLVVEMVLKEVNAFDAQLGRILGDPRKPRGSSHRRVFNVSKTPMELELDRMMAKKLQAFAPIPFSRKSAVAGILRIAFKALYEYVREQTFAKFGLQQIQVDASLFAELVRDFVDAEDASTLGNLLSEAVSSASQRCAEPELMGEAAVEALCDRKKRSLRID